MVCVWFIVFFPSFVIFNSALKYPDVFSNSSRSIYIITFECDFTITFHQPFTLWLYKRVPNGQVSMWLKTGRNISVIYQSSSLSSGHRRGISKVMKRNRDDWSWHLTHRMLQGRWPSSGRSQTLQGEGSQGKGDLAARLPLSPARGPN